MRTDEPILTISIAANLLKLHPRTLMLYEHSGLITPYRTVSQRRLYSLKNLDELQFIKYLTQEEGLNLKGVRLILKSVRLAKEMGLELSKSLFPAFKPQKLI